VDGYDITTYGERIADVYDQWYGEAELLQTDAAVAALAELAGAGPALELAIGTGRIALPLAGQGLEVHGIDASEAMVAKLREKPGGDRIPVTMGNFADVGVDGRYTLVYLVFNTLFALDSQDEQVRCFQNVAGHLADGGVFVIEAFVPKPERFDGSVRVSKLDTDLVQLDMSLVDRNEQRSETQHVALTPDGLRFYPVRIRWAYPPELDLMARLAGLHLRERWSNWGKEPFTKTSQKHVSVYERAISDPEQPPEP
jgi:SAM-dependent methyltransferase